MVVVLRRQQVLVAKQVRHIERGQRLTPTQCDVAAHVRQSRCELFDETGEGQVEEHVACFGVADDETHLIGEETGVDGVQHGPAAGDAKIDFKVAVVVPRESGDPLTLCNAQPPQRIGGPFGARGNRAPIATLDRSLD